MTTKKAAIAAPAPTGQNKYEHLKDSLDLIKVVEHLTKEEVIEIGTDTHELETRECPLCGAHDAFRINTGEPPGYYNCFSCSKGGDVINFAATYWKLSNSEAFDRLKEYVFEGKFVREDSEDARPRPLPAPKLAPEQAQRRGEILEAATQYYQGCLDRSALAKAYQTEKRKHHLDVLAGLRIGFSDGRLVEHLISLGFEEKELKEASLENTGGKDFIHAGCFIYPHIGPDGTVYRISVKDPEKKTGYQPRKQGRLPGPPFYIASQPKDAKRVLIVEGQNDAISILEAGWDGGILATNGSLSEEQLAWVSANLTGLQVVTAFDNDPAGEGYRRKVAELDVRVNQYCPPGEGEDPDSFLKGGGTLEGLMSADRLWTLASGPASKSKGMMRLEEMHDGTNARILTGLILHSARYVPESERWAWCEDDGFWAMDQDHMVMQQSQEAARAWALEAERTKDAVIAGRFMAFYTQSSNLTGLRSMAKVASSHPALRLSASEFDNDDGLIGLDNGVYELVTGVFRPARPKDYVSRRMKVSYDANAKCPLWLKFLDDTVAGKDEHEKQAMKDYLQMIAGMALSGYSERRKTFHMYGPPGSGKSLFQNTIRDLFGDYATTLSASALSQPYFSSSDAKHPEIADLAGRRLAIATEMGSECHWNDDLVKRLTGGDEMTARKLYQNPIRFRCKATIMSCGNGRPAHSTTSPEGLMSRLDVVPFPNAVPVELQDKELPAKLRAEFPGILNWAVQGERMFREAGYRIDAPGPVKRESAAYLEDSDDVARFIQDSCDLGVGHKVSTTMFYQAYKAWATANGVMPKSGRRLGDYMLQNGHPKSRVDNVAHHVGLKMKDDYMMTDLWLGR